MENSSLFVPFTGTGTLKELPIGCIRSDGRPGQHPRCRHAEQLLPQNEELLWVGPSSVNRGYQASGFDH
jgi:hypothetical protein